MSIVNFFLMQLSLVTAGPGCLALNKLMKCIFFAAEFANLKLLVCVVWHQAGLLQEYCILTSVVKRMELVSICHLNTKYNKESLISISIIKAVFY